MVWGKPGQNIERARKTLSKTRLILLITLSLSEDVIKKEQPDLAFAQQKKIIAIKSLSNL
jgi:hypothetical protein